MPTRALHLLLLLVVAAPTASGFHISVAPISPTHSTIASRGPIRHSSARMGPLQDAWRRYVLLRPDMGFEELKNSTQLRTANEWSWDTRTPGTARTLLISAFVVSFFAIPAILANPAVFTRLLELAALSLEGVRPLDLLRDTGRLF